MQNQTDPMHDGPDASADASAGESTPESPAEGAFAVDAQNADPINLGPNSLAISHGIEVEAAAQFLKGRSFPEQKRWLYAYKVRIQNVSDEPQKLLSRHWIITDANGERREVRGVGVVGEQPHLQPGESHEYRSMCDLSTAWGTMEGSFLFVTDGGEEREVRVGRFFLVESAENAIVVE